MARLDSNMELRELTGIVMHRAACSSRDEFGCVGACFLLCGRIAPCVENKGEFAKVKESNVRFGQ